ncbi:MAG TPA: M20/M25/M40 family metallo-hydrolase [Thermoanaerobaculia bacterium]
MRIRLFIALFLVTSSNFADEDVGPKVRAYRVAHERAILNELVELLSIPNVASDRANIEKNAALLTTMLERRGIATELLRLGDAPPVVFGELRQPRAKKTIIFYAHYDGQPVDGSQWTTDPWKPVIRDGRLYARSASDDKAPIVALLAALDALRANKISPSVNLKVFLEGEEEASSPHLRAILEEYADKLRGDLWIFADGPVHQSRKMQVYLGVRGVTDLEITMYGPSRSLHSGHYGNWAPNPAALLTNLLASLRDADGRILIDGYYDDVASLSESESRALKLVPDVDEALRNEVRLSASESSNARLVERIGLPAMNIRGIQSGAVGAKAANAIPTTATASIDFRLVSNQTPEKVRQRVEEHLTRLGYTIVRDEPELRGPKVVRLEWGEGGYPPVRISLDHPIVRRAVEVIGDTLVVPTLGGSLPIYHFTEVLGTPLLGVPIVNHDNSQHAANENLRLQNLWDGIEVFARLLAGL